MGVSGSTSIALGFIVRAGLCHEVRSEVLILSTWFCHKFSSGSLFSLDPNQPGKELEFGGLIGTKTSLATERRRNKFTRSAKAFRMQAEVSGPAGQRAISAGRRVVRSQLPLRISTNGLPSPPGSLHGHRQWCDMDE